MAERLTASRRRDPALAFGGLPVPYDGLNGSLDGRALWFGRVALDLDPSLFEALGVPGLEPRTLRNEVCGHANLHRRHFRPVS